MGKSRAFLGLAAFVLSSLLACGGDDDGTTLPPAEELALDGLDGEVEVLYDERGIPHILLVPCLFLTLMFGPGGWLLYMALRTVRSPTPV